MGLGLFGDFGFVGPDDTTANPYQDAQQCINWYPEVSPASGTKVVASLLGRPGLVPLANPGNVPFPLWTLGDTLVTAGAPQWTLGGQSYPWPLPSPVTDLPVRGGWVLPGWQQALVVIGNTCYLVTIGSYGSLNSPGSIALTKVGTLRTSAGPVGIRDLGQLGGYAVVVDGDNGYWYNINTQAFTQITDPAFLGATSVAFIDGWLIFNKPNSPTFFTNYPQYGTGFSGSYFANADSMSDNLVAVFESKEELWLLCERHTEIWYDAGGQYFPFQRLVGTPLQYGCNAPYSVARMISQGNEGLIWLGRNELGETVVLRSMGFVPKIVSTPAVSNAISQYAMQSDAIGISYQEGTHEFYELTFPTADKTWVYDASMPPQLAWTQRASYDPYAGQFHRSRTNCLINFAGMRIVGDYQCGALYQLTRAAYTDAGWPIYGRRQSPFIWDRDDRERVFMQSLQVEFAPGQGTAAGIGVDPQAYLSVSRDYGTTFGAPSPAAMGAQGQYLNRCMWRRLGWSRGAVLQLDVMAPVNRDIVGATLRAVGP